MEPQIAGVSAGGSSRGGGRGSYAGSAAAYASNSASNYAQGNGAIPTLDGGFVVFGFDVTLGGVLIKFDAGGNVVWSKLLNNGVAALAQNADGTLLAVGSTTLGAGG